MNRQLRWVEEGGRRAERGGGGGGRGEEREGGGGEEGEGWERGGKEGQNQGRGQLQLCWRRGDESILKRFWVWRGEWTALTTGRVLYRYS